MRLVQFLFCAGYAVEGDAFFGVGGSKCDEAYEQRCFETMPFNSCCAKCSDGWRVSTCDWSFSETAGKSKFAKVLSGSFTFSLDMKQCANACKAFLDPANILYDYCSGGKVAEASRNCAFANESLVEAFQTKAREKHMCQRQAQAKLTCAWSFEREGITMNDEFSFGTDNADCFSACGHFHAAETHHDFCEGGSVAMAASVCPPARQSLKRALPINLCQTRVESTVRCDWQFERGTRKTRKSDQLTLDGSFTFLPNNSNCADACKSLGDQQSLFSDYCQGGGVWNAVQGCPDASRSLLKAQSIHKYCNNATRVTLNPSRGTTNVCAKAFEEQCWKENAFKSCCGDCGSSEAEMTCKWKYNGPMGEVAEGSFLMEGPMCISACQAFRVDIRHPGDLCPGSAWRGTIDKCEQGKLSVLAALKNVNNQKLKDGKQSWCGKAEL